jgi:hypothetical protein
MARLKPCPFKAVHFMARLKPCPFEGMLHRALTKCLIGRWLWAAMGVI